MSAGPTTGTIIAVASAPGHGTRGVVRISGPATGALLAAIEHGPCLDDVQTRPARASVRAMLLRLPLEAMATTPSGAGGPAGAHADELLLPALCVRWHAPRSYTGEDAAELLVPGQPALLAMLVRALLLTGAGAGAGAGACAGVREAGPGEFTARAYLSGKLGLARAEGVAALIAADGEEQLAAARALHDGQLGALYAGWADELTTLLALVEAGIDFTDQEDVVPIAPAQLSARLAGLREAVATHVFARSGGEAPRGLPTIALVGEPNAGKSTLFNALLGRARAIADPLAGTTRDVLDETLDLERDAPGAGQVRLLDLPGLDRALARGGAGDRAAQLAAQQAAVRADVLVWCDGHGRFDEAQLEVLLQQSAGWLRSRRVLRVRTFADRPLGASNWATAGAATDADARALAVCGLDGWNLGPLRRALADQACGVVARAAGVAALLPRYRRALLATLAALDEARAMVASDGARGGAEEQAQCLREALSHLGELVGRISPDDVLGRIFASFCVGK